MGAMVPTWDKHSLRCPECGSTSTRRREVVHKSGTSYYSGRSRGRGFSFGLSRRSRPRLWFGSGSHRGKRQNVLAQELEPIPIVPPALVLLFIYIFHPLWGIGAFTGIVILFCVLMLVAGFVDIGRYRDEWVCSRCDSRFIPKKFLPALPTDQGRISGRDCSTKHSEQREGSSHCQIHEAGLRKGAEFRAKEMLRLWVYPPN